MYYRPMTCSLSQNRRFCLMLSAARPPGRSWWRGHPRLYTWRSARSRPASDRPALLCLWWVDPGV